MEKKKLNYFQKRKFQKNFNKSWIYIDKYYEVLDKLYDECYRQTMTEKTEKQLLESKETKLKEISKKIQNIKKKNKLIDYSFYVDFTEKFLNEIKKFKSSKNNDDRLLNLENLLSYQQKYLDFQIEILKKFKKYI